MPANPNKHYTNYLQIKGNNIEAVKFTQNTDKTLNFKAGTNVSISATSGEITISSTDTNTATAADNILDGSNSGTEITYKPYTSQQSKLSFDTSTTNPTRTDRLNLNGYLYATKLYSGGKEVLTSHQNISGKLDKTTYEVNRTINFGQDGALYIGKFKVYDTNVTFEITSTTSVTYSGKLVIAAQNYVIREAKVYGDAANTVTPNIYIKPSTTSDPYIEVYFKPESWSKNVVHIYGSNIQATPTDVCTSIPSVPSTATLKPKNALPIYSLSGTTLTITM